MTLKQASKLVVGNKVIWPEGANGCKRSVGVVMKDPVYDNLFVMWPDAIQGERTYLHDEAAVKYLQLPNKGY